MNKHTIVSGYKIINIALLESQFKRELLVSSRDVSIEQETKVFVEYDINEPDRQILVTQTFRFKQEIDKKEEISAKIVMIGHFEKLVLENNEEGNIELERFAQINGPAILYPYVREHFSNLTSKAAVGTIILPPYNFMPDSINDSKL